MWTEDVKFAGFGPNSLDPHAPRELTEVGGKLPGELRKAVRTSVPKLPGVYGMLDRDERLIYVGKSKSLRNRLLSYFNPAVAEEKAGRIITAAERIVWEESSSEFAALLREQQLIRRWTPVGMCRRCRVVSGRFTSVWGVDRRLIFFSRGFRPRTRLPARVHFAGLGEWGKRSTPSIHFFACAIARTVRDFIFPISCRCSTWTIGRVVCDLRLALAAVPARRPCRWSLIIRNSIRRGAFWMDSMRNH